MPNKYEQLTGELLANHLEGYLVPHFSVSAVETFTHNEKAFERTYIFGDYSKKDSLASIVGSVYHKALALFWLTYKEGHKMSFTELTDAAYYGLDRIGADRYRPQVKLSIAEMQNKALADINKLLSNFYAELPAYEGEVAEVVEVEKAVIEFIELSGVEIPLPLKVKIDLIFIDHAGHLCILDHKAKHTYTPEAAITMKYGDQAVTNMLAVNKWVMKQEELLAKYPKAAEGVKKFFFYENKSSTNRDGSNQIKLIQPLINESREIFEALLLERTMKLIEAVSNPDHVYTINAADHYEDPAELMDFWVRTHLEGLEGWPNLTDAQKVLLSKRKQNIRRSALSAIPKSVVKEFATPKDFLTYEDMTDKTPAEKIEFRLRTLNYQVKVEHVIEGYSCDTYLVSVGAGLKTDKLYTYAMDVANALDKESVRITPMTVHEGRSFIGIEVAREERRMLQFTKDDLEGVGEFPIGRTNFGEKIVWDTNNPSTPHLMIAGSSGSGKSVAIRNIINVAKMSGVQVTILDPKYEFTDLSGECDVHQELDNIETFVACAVLDMDAHFKSKGANAPNKHLIIFDEAADCFTKQTKTRKITTIVGINKNYAPHVAATLKARGEPYIEQYKTKVVKDESFKTLEENVLILAQKARSAGIHLVLAAQRFSVKILTGDAKANFSSRLALTVASAVDSKVMLDEAGAEKLTGKGDALFTSPEYRAPVRIQCFSS